MFGGHRNVVWDRFATGPALWQGRSRAVLVGRTDPKRKTRQKAGFRGFQRF